MVGKSNCVRATSSAPQRKKKVTPTGNGVSKPTPVNENNQLNRRVTTYSNTNTLNPSNNKN